MKKILFLTALISFGIVSRSQVIAPQAKVISIKALTEYSGICDTCYTIITNGDVYNKVQGKNFHKDSLLYRNDSAFIMKNGVITFQALMPIFNYLTVRKDTVVTVRLRTDSTTNSTVNNWNRGSTYIASTTETPVSDGLQIANTDASGFSSSPQNKGAYINPNNCTGANDGTARATYKLVSIGGTNPAIGFLWTGNTGGGGNNTNNAIGFNLVANTVSFRNAASTYSLGSFVAAPEAGDIIRMTVNKQYLNYSILIENITKNTRKIFLYNDSTQAGNNRLFQPGFLIQNTTAIIQDWQYYVNNYNPDIIAVGTSITSGLNVFQTGWNTFNYDSTYAGRIGKQGAKTVMFEASSALLSSQVFSLQREIIKLKPKQVWIELGAADNLLGINIDTIFNRYKRFVDTLTSFGIRVVVKKILPETNTFPAALANFIDSIYSDDTRVYILDEWTTTPMYNADSANFCVTSYFYDGVHPRSTGIKLWSDYAITQLNRLFNPYPYSGVTRVLNTFVNTLIVPGDGSSTTNAYQYTMPANKLKKIGDLVKFTYNANTDSTAGAATLNVQFAGNTAASFTNSSGDWSIEAKYIYISGITTNANVRYEITLLNNGQVVSISNGNIGSVDLTTKNIGQINVGIMPVGSTVTFNFGQVVLFPAQ